jgi:hypothetical protein
VTISAQILRDQVVYLLLNRFQNRTKLISTPTHEPHVGVEVGSCSVRVIRHEGIDDNASATCGSCQKFSSR